jgi:hypothetical protein
MKKLSVSFMSVAQQSVFNSSEWKPVGDAYTLEEICAAGALGFSYKDIEGSEAEVTETEFQSGDTALRITVTLKDGQTPELKAGKNIQDNYDEGDKLPISLIYGQELKKAGQPSIVRFDVWASEEEKKEYLKKRDEE